MQRASPLVASSIPWRAPGFPIVDRIDVEDADAADVEALGAEGMEISVPARGSVRPLLRDMFKHLCSAISYGEMSQ